MALFLPMPVAGMRAFAGDACLQRPFNCLARSGLAVDESEGKVSCYSRRKCLSIVMQLQHVHCNALNNVECRRSSSQIFQCQGRHSSLFGRGCGVLSDVRRRREGGELGFQALNISRRRLEVRASKEPAKKKGLSLGDQLLDYIEGGPKLRKWYGAGEFLPRDGAMPSDRQQEEDEGESEDDGVRDAILVTDADGPTGQLVVLSLILRRARVRALVRDVKAAVAAFGPYVEPISGNVNDSASVDKALRGVRAVISPSKLGLIAKRAKEKKVEHVVLLSQVGVEKGAGDGLGAIFGALTRRQLAEAEAEVAACGVPYTIVRAGMLRDEPGGLAGLKFGQGDVVRGAITREDAATVCVRALDAPPKQSLVFEVVNGNGKVSDWAAVFESLLQIAPTSGT